MIKQLERQCWEKGHEGHEAAEQYRRVLGMHQAALKRKGEDLAAVNASLKAADAAYKRLYAAVSGWIFLAIVAMPTPSGLTGHPAQLSVADPISQSTTHSIVKHHSHTMQRCSACCAASCMCVLCLRRSCPPGAHTAQGPPPVVSAPAGPRAST
jgi:hypothetical protein